MPDLITLLISGFCTLYQVMVLAGHQSKAKHDLTTVCLKSETTQKYVSIYCARKGTTDLVCKQHSLYELIQIGAKIEEADIVRSSRV